MELQTIARRYACALFAIKQHAEVKEFLDALAFLNKNPMFVELINNTVVPPVQKAQVICELFASMPAYFRNFIYLLAEKRRFNCVKLIRREFNKMLSKEENVHYLKLETSDLNALPERSELKSELERCLEVKIELKIKKNAMLIAGSKITLDDHVVDGSFKKLYENLHASMLAP